MRLAPLVLSAAALVLAGCGDSGKIAAASPSTSSPSARASAPRELGSITKSGFGQSDEYVWVSAVVHNNSAYIGQSVTVNFNVLDDSGAVLATESQVEGFSQPNADHIIGTQVALEPGQEAAKVEATLDVDAELVTDDSPFPVIPAAEVKISGTGEYRDVSFLITNPIDVAIKSPRIQIACTDDAGAIIGGGSTYPDLVPPAGKVRVKVDSIISGSPAGCTVFVGAPVGWEGVPEAEASSSPPASAAAEPAGSAEDAFKIWIQQFGKKNWKAQYKTLVSSQQDLLSERKFIACRTEEAPPKVTWVKATSVTDTGATSIPGTKTKLPATKVNARVKVGELTVPVDAHMYVEGGTWKWSLEKDAFAKCSK